MNDVVLFAGDRSAKYGKCAEMNVRLFKAGLIIESSHPVIKCQWPSAQRFYKLAMNSIYFQPTPQLVQIKSFFFKFSRDGASHAMQMGCGGAAVARM